jgi:hypothetical protein
MFICIEDMIIIEPNFNDEIEGKLKNTLRKSKYKQLIFANEKKKDDNYEKMYLRKKINTSNDGDYYSNISQFNKKIDYSNISQFNKKIDNKIPENIEIIILGYGFNQTVDNLPLSLKSIEFGYSFNQFVDNLPYSLESISFGYSFDKPICNLPNSIIKLKLGYSFNNCVDDLPNGLEILILGNAFSKNIDNLPISLKFLEIKNRYYKNDVIRLPKSLELIKMYSWNGEENYNSSNIKFRFNNIKMLFD